MARARKLAERYRLEFIDMDEFRINQELFRAIPADLMLRYEFVPCRNGKYTDNLVVWRSDELSTPVNLGQGTAPETFEFARNWWYCIDAPERSIPRLPVAQRGPAGGSDPKLRDAEHGDLALAEGSPAMAHGAGALPAERK